MSPVWIVSLALAWAVIGLLTAAVVTLLRQVGDLRAGGAVAPASRRGAAGPRLYDEVEAVELPDLAEDGGHVTIGGPQDLPALLVFHTPGCSSCEDIEQALEAVAQQRPDVRVISALGRTRKDARAHARALGARHAVTVAADDVPRALRPDAMPALVALAREGIVAAIGAPEAAMHLHEAADVAVGAVLIAGPDSMRETDWGYAVPAWDTPAMHVVQVAFDERDEPAT